MSFSIRLLGRFAVVRDGEDVPEAAFGGRLARRLLRILAVRRGEFHSKDALAEALWPDRLPSDPSANLEVLVSRVRRALGDATLIETGSGGYALVADERLVVDAELVVADVRDGRAAIERGDPAAALGAFERAVERSAGEPLAEDAYEDWAAPFRTALERTRLEALEGAGSAALESGAPARAVPFAEMAVAIEPNREAAAMLLVSALAESGDPAAALEAFASFRERLAEELGLDPSPEAEALHGQILRGEIAVASSTPRRISTAPRDEVAPFVGRDREVGALLAAERFAVVEGVSGAGKSRLLDETGRRAGVPSLRVAAVLPERDEPWTLARAIVLEALALDAMAARTPPELAAAALAEIVPELRELRDVPAARLDPRSQRALLVEAITQVVGAVATEPLLLLVDDAQWIDASSAHALTVLASRLPTLRLILALRPDDAPTADVVHALERIGVTTRIRVDALNDDAVEVLLGERRVAELVTELTDATPGAVLEIRRALTVRDRLPDDAALRELIVAGHLRATEDRIRRIGDERDVLEILALAGRELAVATIADSTGREPASALASLDALARAGLVRSGERGWSVAHDSIADATSRLLRSTNAIRRQASLASALEAEGAEPSEIAAHLAHAGDVSAAARMYVRATDAALRRFSNGEAETLALAGLAVEPSADVATSLRLALAEARSRAGHLPGAKEALHEALVAVPSGAERSDVLTRLALLESGSEDYERASGLVDLALDEAAEDPARRARAHAVGAIVDLNLGRLDRSEERSSIALGLFEALGDGRGAAGILDGRAMASFLAGRIAEAADAFDRVARLFREAGELMSVGTPRSTRGHALVFLARPAEGLADADEAVELSRMLGHAEGEAYALWHRAEALAALGRSDDAIASGSRALELAERLGHREWTIASLRGLGIARESAGDLEAAAESHRRGLELADGIPLFEGWAAARLATCLLGRGRLDEAGGFVSRALAAASPLAAYEARLAEAELLAARGDPDAAKVARTAAALAEEGGHLVSVPRLRALAGDAVTT